ncbi:AAA family ATPase [Bacillus sp. AFS088145]|uniref:AAA family ATPase n=1 Tax=Bacillus sp. AFS088145 TaxID=2033514 RepID=UPI000BF67285|nr:AAA family ATPase [Bacillus sp. AFS088145]PFH92654.1 hypothetical protein COI44_00240 [Bacillus sp. AFS088145]
MYISNLSIKGYRNIKKVNIKLGKLVVLVGENNSGKSNILRAITLALLSDEVGTVSKKLTWDDINNEAKNLYFRFL